MHTAQCPLFNSTCAAVRSLPTAAQSKHITKYYLQVICLASTCLNKHVGTSNLNYSYLVWPKYYVRTREERKKKERYFEDTKIQIYKSKIQMKDISKKVLNLIVKSVPPTSSIMQKCTVNYKSMRTVDSISTFTGGHSNLLCYEPTIRCNQNVILELLLNSYYKDQICASLKKFVIKQQLTSSVCCQNHLSSTALLLQWFKLYWSHIVIYCTAPHYYEMSQGHTQSY